MIKISSSEDSVSRGVQINLELVSDMNVLLDYIDISHVEFSEYGITEKYNDNDRQRSCLLEDYKEVQHR